MEQARFYSFTTNRKWGKAYVLYVVNMLCCGSRLPVEHLWEHLREKKFPNLACSSLEEVIDKVCEGLTQLESEPKRLRSLTYFPHFRNTS